MQDTPWENRGLTLSGSPKHSQGLRTSFLPGDTFWLRALQRCSSLGSDTGLLRSIYEDGDFRSLNPEQLLESIQPCASGRSWEGLQAGARGLWWLGWRALTASWVWCDGIMGTVVSRCGMNQKFLLRKPPWSQSPPSRAGATREPFSQLSPASLPCSCLVPGDSRPLSQPQSLCRGGSGSPKPGLPS